MAAHIYGHGVDLGGPQQRLVLAVLLAEAGRQVSTQTLIDRVWDSAPGGARRTLQVHITRLRRLLAQATAIRSVRAVSLSRRSGGYLLDIDPGRVDVHRFRQLVASARDLDCPDVDRVAGLRQAIGLWRAEPLSDLSGQWAASTRAAWQQEQLEAVVLWAQAEHRVGNAAAVIGPLTEFTGQHPLAETVIVELMRALHTVGRTADALDRYTRTRQTLADELGIDPGLHLRQLYLAILRGESGRMGTASSTIAESRAVTQVPRQLPAPLRMFTGRIHELVMLEQIQAASGTVLGVIDGMAGVGKTALAAYVANRLADRYPDGQLFIDLHGYTQGIEPIAPDEALDRILRSLGIPGTQIPASLDERSALYRTLLADRQMLIVLDNVASETQVVPLLPNAPGCLVLITSR